MPRKYRDVALKGVVLLISLKRVLIDSIYLYRTWRSALSGSKSLTSTTTPKTLPEQPTTADHRTQPQVSWAIVEPTEVDLDVDVVVLGIATGV